jgi:hypothetical protein
MHVLGEPEFSGDGVDFSVDVDGLVHDESLFRRKLGAENGTIRNEAMAANSQPATREMQDS